jgi:hypothetical protein
MPSDMALFYPARWDCHPHIAPLLFAVLMGGRRQIFRSSGFNYLVIIESPHGKGGKHFILTLTPPQKGV